jgi:hypothetical protein
LFSALLDIHRADWRIVAYQLIQGIRDAQVSKARLTKHGIQYSALLLITGPTGKSATVNTGWIIEDGKPARLVTAFPAERALQGQGIRTSLPLVDRNLAGGPKWRRLYELASEAGKSAAAFHVATPMFISVNSNRDDVDLVLDGACGIALICIPDARASFSRWLLREGLADRNYPRGVAIAAPRESQGVEPAFSYALAFVQVLWLNGIDAEATRILT